MIHNFQKGACSVTRCAKSMPFCFDFGNNSRRFVELLYKKDISLQLSYQHVLQLPKIQARPLPNNWACNATRTGNLLPQLWFLIQPICQTNRPIGLIYRGFPLSADGLELNGIIVAMFLLPQLSHHLNHRFYFPRESIIHPTIIVRSIAR